MLRNEKISHFSLQGILEPEHQLAIDPTSGLVALLSMREERALLEASVQLTPSELYMLMPLLESYPYFCSYEVLLASINGQPTEKDFEYARERLEDARQEGTWDLEIRLVRNVLSRARIKLRTLGINIVSIIETGYILNKVHSRSTHQ